MNISHTFKIEPPWPNGTKVVCIDDSVIPGEEKRLFPALKKMSVYVIRGGFVNFDYQGVYLIGVAGQLNDSGDECGANRRRFIELSEFKSKDRL